MSTLINLAPPSDRVEERGLFKLGTPLGAGREEEKEEEEVLVAVTVLFVSGGEASSVSFLWIEESGQLGKVSY